MSFSILLIGTLANILSIALLLLLLLQNPRVSEKVAFLVVIFLFTNTYSPLLEQVAHLFDSVRVNTVLIC